MFRLAYAAPAVPSVWIKRAEPAPWPEDRADLTGLGLICHPVRMRQVTVLGSCGAFPEPGRACSGFAVDWDGYRLVMDLGYATLPRLLAHWPDGVLDAVAITHEHRRDGST